LTVMNMRRISSVFALIATSLLIPVRLPAQAPTSAPTSAQMLDWLTAARQDFVLPAFAPYHLVATFTRTSPENQRIDGRYEVIILGQGESSTTITSSDESFSSYTTGGKSYAIGDVNLKRTDYGVLRAAINGFPLFTSTSQLTYQQLVIHGNQLDCIDIHNSHMNGVPRVCLDPATHGLRAFSIDTTQRRYDDPEPFASHSLKFRVPRDVTEIDPRGEITIHIDSLTVPTVTAIVLPDGAHEVIPLPIAGMSGPIPKTP
jgi:hypothetical protein